MSTSASPRPPKPLLWFVAHALVLTLLLGFWPTPRAAYPALFHAHANALLAAFGTPAVRLETPAPDAEAPIETDTVMFAVARGAAEPPWASYFSVARIGYWPSAMLVAMLLATPLAPLRRLLALACGLALVDAFTLARIGVEALYASYEFAHGPGAPARDLGHLLLRVGSESLTATIPSVAWVLVCWLVTASPWRVIDVSAARAWIGGRAHP